MDRKIDTDLENCRAGRVLLLHPDDNVVTACRDLAAGFSFVHHDRQITLARGIKLGFKIAVCPIRCGDCVTKHGAPIGSAIRDIAVGDRVHLNNMKSDYLPTYTLAPSSAGKG